ncbi:glycosyltransferase [Bosea beijingensis]|uniref:glycosyltransferase n=1 Tax=Bosea beijingensis TaxID=3068632 RepID=UPI00274253BF|nr:glycosyltransferase [Bosea sp. REN20]
MPFIGTDTNDGPSSNLLAKFQQLTSRWKKVDADTYIQNLILTSQSRFEIATFTRQVANQHSVFMHYAQRGDALRDQRDWHRAFLEYRAGLNVLPLHSGYLVQAGHMLKEMGSSVAAEGYYRSAVLIGSPIAEVGEHLLHVSHRNGFAETASNLTALVGAAASGDAGMALRPTFDDLTTLVTTFVGTDESDSEYLVEWMRQGLSFAGVVDEITRQAPPAALLWNARHSAHTANGTSTPHSRKKSPFWQRMFTGFEAVSTPASPRLKSEAPGGSVVRPAPLPQSTTPPRPGASTSPAPTTSAMPAANRQANTSSVSQARPAQKLMAPSSWRSPWERRVPLLSAIGSRSVIEGDTVPASAIELCRRALKGAPQKVSVVMPAWNRAHVVKRAIESVIAQSYRAHELIVVDDGSTDETISVIETGFPELIKSGWLTLVKAEHGGISKARNAGLSRASGDLVAYLDSDNHWHKHFLCIMAAAFAQCEALGTAYCAEHINDLDKGTDSVLGVGYQRENLVHRNFIDLNCFVHKRSIVTQQGLFDDSMTRLVDWDLIIRYTRFNPPAFIPVSLVEYYLDKKTLNNVTLTEKWDINFARVATKNLRERVALGIDPPRIAYMVWDWPALSQTFVLNELRWLVSNHFDVKVYYKTAPDLAASLDFKISAKQILTAEELAEALKADRRNILHSPFAYPATTQLTWPAAQMTGIPFTFMPGGVDISHHSNRLRNRVGEVASDPLCSGVITLGTYHERFLRECGVPSTKIVPERQAVGLPEAKARPFSRAERPRVISIGRMIEKKGFRYLIEAAALTPELDFVIYGYGPLEAELREQVTAARINNVAFAGTLDDTASLHQAYFDADIFALPCVEALNGDMDGLPTVLIEAMAAGVPVVTSRLANIPDLITHRVDGLLTAPKDVEALTTAIRELCTMPDAQRRRLINAARSKSTHYASTDRMMHTMLDVWRGRMLDIVLVTYDTPKYDDWATTSEIIDRIYAHTSLPFNLIVVDNNSQQSFRDRMKERYGARSNFTFIESRKNLFCGPGTNLGIDAGTSEYIVYICSKEGFILKNGWDRELVRAMDDNSQAALGGYRISLPKFRNGAEYANYPSFEKWRRQDFARANPRRRFQHIQGGLFILRRSAYNAVGGFSDEVAQDGTDIEYSYFLESKGYELADIPAIRSISSKTLPAPHTLVDENAYIMHPLTLASAPGFDQAALGTGMLCSLCGGHTIEDRKVGKERVPVCVDCGSMPFDRSTMRYLSLSGVLQRRPPVTMIGRSHALETANKRLCPAFATLSGSAPDVAALVAGIKNPEAHVLIVEPQRWRSKTQAASAAASIAAYVAAGGRVIAGAGRDASGNSDLLIRALQEQALGFDEVAYASNACAFDTQPIIAIGFPQTRGGTPVGDGTIGRSLNHANL